MWWVVLTLTWFLAAGLKWGHEAIERIAYYFHVAAWGLPLVKLLAILWVQRVDADILAGVCFVGIRNMAMMRAFVLSMSLLKAYFKFNIKNRFLSDLSFSLIKLL